MRTTKRIVFLVDVDDTLLDNDRIQEDLQRHIERQFGRKNRQRFWTIQEQLFQKLGYRDYLGALQRFRVEHPYEPHLITAANYLVDYPFANRLYPGALNDDDVALIAEHLKSLVPQQSPAPPADLPKTRP